MLNGFPPCILEPTLFILGGGGVSMDTVLNKADSGYKSLHHGLKKAMFTRRPSTELGGPWLQADPEVTAMG